MVLISFWKLNFLRKFPCLAAYSPSKQFHDSVCLLIDQNDCNANDV